MGCGVVVVDVYRSAIVGQFQRSGGTLREGSDRIQRYALQTESHAERTLLQFGAAFDDVGVGCAADPFGAVDGANSGRQCQQVSRHICHMCRICHGWKSD